MDFSKLVKVSLIVVLVCLYVPLTYAQTLARSFQPPVAANASYFTTSTNQGWIVAQDHQDCRPEPDPTGTPCRHLGEDWNYWTGSDYDNVRRPIHAIGNGYVMASGAVSGFAGYVILKHHLPGGSDILSIYGHLQPTELPQIGDYYSKGRFLANTANQSEMNTWTSFRRLYYLRTGLGGLQVKKTMFDNVGFQPYLRVRTEPTNIVDEKNYDVLIEVGDKRNAFSNESRVLTARYQCKEFSSGGFLEGSTPQPLFGLWSNEVVGVWGIRMPFISIVGLSPSDSGFELIALFFTRPR